MSIAAETRIFAKLLELLLQHQIKEGELRTWWDNGVFTYSLTGEAPEVAVSFADFSHFELVCREREDADADELFIVPDDVTDEELSQIIEDTIQYILTTQPS